MTRREGAQARHDGAIIPRSMAARSYYAISFKKETFTLDARYSNPTWLGSGAYGSVIACTDAKSGRRVAIKKVRGVFKESPLDG